MDTKTLNPFSFLIKNTDIQDKVLYLADFYSEGNVEKFLQELVDSYYVDLRTDLAEHYGNLS